MSDDRNRVDLTWRSGREAVLGVESGGLILDAAEDEGLGLPFGCRTGACATCTARVLSGNVTHQRPPRALKPRHLDDGYVLTCIATPTSDCELDVGADVADDLVDNPWK